MSLTAGTKLGTFEIIGILGKGGMGEVYRATDTKLGREVAIKVLNADFSGNSEMRSRFEREARNLASLDHPNVGALYDFQHDGDTHFLVMQLIEGKTLSERIESGALSPDETITLFQQIAEGLEAAHNAGIVHRDLKPANIKITNDDHVKVLDFGIAKTSEGLRAPGAFTPTPTTGFDGAAPTVPMNSPMPAADLTAAGAFIGTPHYMSPEQARGKIVDKRADIWAFGVCLFEALTGTMPFNGDTVSDLVTAILRDKPDLDALPDTTPINLRTLIERCLNKDPRYRMRDIGEAWIQLKQGDSAPTTNAVMVQDKTVTRFRATFPANHQLATTLTPIALSPDGKRIACVLKSSSGDQLYLRRLDDLEFKRIPGTERGRGPVFSPDGKSIAFAQRRSIRLLSVEGNSIRTLLDCKNTPVAIVWTHDNYIIWGELGSGVSRMRVDGTNQEVLTTADKEKGEFWHATLSLLDDGEWIAYMAIGGDRQYEARYLSLKTGEQRIESGYKDANSFWYSTEGYGLFHRLSVIYAAKATGSPPTFSGHPVKVLEGYAVDGDDLAIVALAENGTLAYAPNTSSNRPNKLYWVTRDGDRREIPVADNMYIAPRVSPDGDFVIMGCTDRAGAIQVALLDIRRGVVEMITSAQGRGCIAPQWTHDSESIVYGLMVGNKPHIRRLNIDTGIDELVQEGPFGEYPYGYSRDGRHFAFVVAKSNVDSQIFIQTDDNEPEPLADTNARDITPAFDPAGDNIAYGSNESGRWEVYIKPFGRQGRRIQVSLDGGSDPVWAPDGSEIFYRNGDTVYAATIERNGRLRIGQSEPLFEFPFGDKVSLYAPSFDIHPEGDRFIMVDRVAAELSATELIVVQNFIEEVKQLLPNKEL